MLTLRSCLAAFADLTEEDWAAVEAQLHTRQFAKGTLIARPGEHYPHALFVQRGLARTYVLDAAGHDVTYNLHFNSARAGLQHLLLVDYLGFVFDEPTEFYFEALSPLEVSSIDLAGVNRLLARHPKWQALGRRLGELMYQYLYNRALSLLAEPAADRYQRLLREMPDLLCQVPLRYIASYLGITPQSLSRLRRGLSR